ncbi:hypothetical protein H5410_026013 [Solanum commersonii]|uniref:Uncharacterized protein n=1 Tax=Solanum commersonii TaxID=4109 RepID=A0A9J5YVB5_SOLCO|nr:hypothetical protein H5410_026013 [Solanum commersonii]
MGPLITKEPRVLTGACTPLRISSPTYAQPSQASVTGRLETRGRIKEEIVRSFMLPMLPTLPALFLRGRAFSSDPPHFHIGSRVPCGHIPAMIDDLRSYQWSLSCLNRAEFDYDETLCEWCLPRNFEHE